MRLAGSISIARAAVAACVLALSGAALARSQVAKLVASDTDVVDNFGLVAVDGSTLVVGAINADPGGGNAGAGAAYVFEFDGAGWVQRAKLRPSDLAGDDEFGAFVAIDGNTIVVGSPQDDDGGSSSGSAYVFVRPSTGWVDMTETVKLTASDAAAADNFGASVAISGATIVVGTIGDDGYRGSAYVFERPGATWVTGTETAKLVPSAASSNSFTGRGVAIDGSTIVVGAEFGGAITVFERQSGSWVERGTLTTSSFADRFGYGLDVRGDLIVVGAFLDDANGSDSGSAYLYQKPASGWQSMTQTARLTASGGSANDMLGLSVSILDQCTVFVGTHAHRFSASTPGYVCKYSRPAGGWVDMTETAVIGPDDGAIGDQFGTSIDTSGETLVVGSNTNDESGTDSGAAYVFHGISDPGSECADEPPTCSVDLTIAQTYFLETAPGSFVVTEGETITVDFTGDDPDGDTLTTTLGGLPGTATLSASAGAAPLVTTVEWTPAAADKAGAPYTASVTFQSPSGDTAVCEFAVADVNLRPDCSSTTGADSTLVVECDTPGGAEVTLGGAATDPDDPTASLMYHWDVSDASVTLDDDNIATPTGVFPIGVTMATLTVADGRGGVETCDVLIEVRDAMPPEVMCTTNVATLWPPNHRMVDVTIVVTATDACEDPAFIFPLSIFCRSDEPDDAAGSGDGSTSGDVNGHDGFSAPVNILGQMIWNATVQAYVGTIQLRAERASGGDGRKYTIDVTALDSHGNAAITSCCVVVPHDRRGG